MPDPLRMPVIVGPTAGGKSALAMELARALGSGAEIVSADAFQVYRGMDIGTAKPPRADRDEIPHHLIDIVEPTEPFTVADWLARAEEAIAQVRARGGVPIVVGGTHLYAKALLSGMFEGPSPDPGVRESLRAMEQPMRYAELLRVDPQAAARIHPNDDRRTVRALEVFRQTGRPISALQVQWAAGRSDALLVTLEWQTAALNRRINERVRAMMEGGLLAEVETLWHAGRLGAQARQALGYKQLIEHLEGRADLESAVEQVKIETRRLGKNQRTWIRRLAAEHPGVHVEGCVDGARGRVADIFRTMRPEA